MSTNKKAVFWNFDWYLHNDILRIENTFNFVPFLILKICELDFSRNRIMIWKAQIIWCFQVLNCWMFEFRHDLIISHGHNVIQCGIFCKTCVVWCRKPIIANGAIGHRIIDRVTKMKLHYNKVIYIILTKVS